VRRALNHPRVPAPGTRRTMNNDHMVAPVSIYFRDSRHVGPRNRPGQCQRRRALRCDRPKHPESIFADRRDFGLQLAHRLGGHDREALRAETRRLLIGDPRLQRPTAWAGPPGGQGSARPSDRRFSPLTLPPVAQVTGFPGRPQGLLRGGQATRAFPGASPGRVDGSGGLGTDLVAVEASGGSKETG
jgi:hypothetical protein